MYNIWGSLRHVKFTLCITANLMSNVLGVPCGPCLNTAVHRRQSFFNSAVSAFDCFAEVPCAVTTLCVLCTGHLSSDELLLE